jgi:hypothetical protein
LLALNEVGDAHFAMEDEINAAISATFSLGPPSNLIDAVRK